jgi:Flp pilus assembly protein TadD
MAQHRPRTSKEGTCATCTLVLAAALGLSACGGQTASGLKALAEDDTASRTAQKVRAAVPVDAAAAATYASNPTESLAARAYAKALRSSGQKSKAMAVLDKAAASKPGDRQLQLERGLLALELGDAGKAERLLRQAQDAKAPDWRLHSGLGVALASLGRQQEAQVQFATALSLAPDQPAVLNNLALSYALDGKASEAERLLRRAQRAEPKSGQMHQNLALVLGLRGKYGEARSVVEGALSSSTADDNVSYLQKLTESKDSAKAATANKDASASLPQPLYQLGVPPERN